MNVLFWNMQGKILDECLLEIILENNCDFIVLAEYPGNVEAVCNCLNTRGNKDFSAVPNMGGCDKIKAMINSVYRVESILEQSRYQIVKIKTSYYQLIVAMMHNISKLYASEEEQSENLRQMNYDILEKEKEHQTRNVLIVGDLNVNPFEKSCVAANTVHGIPYKEELRQEGRKVQGRIYREFYNPMWKFLGRKESPFGTCFYNQSALINYFWNIFDQFLVRPELADALDEESLSIITKTATKSLVDKNGKPDSRLYSDHLPVFVRIVEGKIR